MRRTCKQGRSTRGLRRSIRACVPSIVLRHPRRNSRWSRGSTPRCSDSRKLTCNPASLRCHRRSGANCCAVGGWLHATSAMWDWLFQFIGPLERANVPYAIVGSVAASVYGEPRATNDVDLLIQLARADAGKLADAFPSEDFYVPPREVIEVELGRAHGGHINVIALERRTSIRCRRRKRSGSRAGVPCRSATARCGSPSRRR
jgi:hypothetical protein